MKTEWIIGVLADVARFSRESGLHGLAEHLDDAVVVAALEIGRAATGMPIPSRPSERSSHPAFRPNRPSGSEWRVCL